MIQPATVILLVKSALVRYFMKPIHRLLLFLFINVVVSAATTLLVLNWYRTANPYPTPIPQVNIQNTPASDSPSEIANPERTKVSLPPLTQKVVEIQNVFGAGDANLEVVVIRRNGDGDLPMTGWRLQDEQGNYFTFPDLTLFKDGAVQVYTRSGDNTATALYWKRSKPVWQAGKNVLLVDPEGNIRSSYTIR
jgi:hypothetical protein